MPTFRTPTFAVALPGGDYFDSGSRVDQLKAQHGHIVVRVEPGGGKYRVFVLDDTTSEATVVSVHGPYLSR